MVQTGDQIIERGAADGSYGGTHRLFVRGKLRFAGGFTAVLSKH